MRRAKRIGATCNGVERRFLLLEKENVLMERDEGKR